MKKISLIILIIIAVTTVFAACSSNNDTENFTKFLQNDNGEILLPSGINIIITSVDKETKREDRLDKDGKYGDVDIVLIDINISHDIFINMGEYNFEPFLVNMSNEELKIELKYIGDKFSEFATGKKWDNGYYLLVKFSFTDHPLDGNVVYDYKKNLLYAPDNLNDYHEMFQTFSTTNSYSVARMEGGIEWLREKKLGEYRSSGKRVYMTVIIDGEFSEWGTENSVIIE